MKPLSFNNKSAVIVCHDSMPGPPHETLRDYLLNHDIKRLVFIGHVNQYVVGNPVKSSYVKIYEDGKLIQDTKAAVVYFPEPLMYVHDVLLSFYWTLKYTRGRIDVFVGLANLNAIIGVLLQKLGMVKDVIYYVIDYVPKRFSNSFLNSMYHFLDKICAEQSSYTWNYGKGMMLAREQHWGKKFPRQRHTPHGVEINKKILSIKDYNQFSLVYLGTLYEQQGLQIVLEALPTIKKVFPAIHVSVIGVGPYRKDLERLISHLNLQKNVTFLGFIKNTLEVDKIIAKACVGIATYKNDIGFVMYTEPGKVKRYLACGVPVIITKHTPLAVDIEENRCGIVCDFDKDEIAKGIITCLKHKKNLGALRENALNYATHYTWERIYTEAFNESI